MIALFAVLAASMPAQGSDAHWIVDAREREVGEPFEAALLVEHAPAARAECDDTLLEADSSWVVFEGPRRSVERGVDGGERGSRWTWQLASLEPGERPLPDLAIVLTHDDGRRETLAVEPAAARFLGVLAEGEDDPRPALGFRPIEGRAASGWAPWAVGGAVALALGVAAWLVTRRKAKSSAAAPPTALERLAQMEQRRVEERDAARETFYELTALVREHVDARANASRSALTDAEWLDAITGEAPPAALEELRVVLARAEAVKYGGEHPTHWAVSEALASARRALSQLGEPERRAA